MIQAQYNRIRSYPVTQGYYNRVTNARRIAQTYIDNIDARLNRLGRPISGRENLMAPQYVYRYERAARAAALGNANG